MTVRPSAEADLRKYFADITRLGSNVNQLVREINSDTKTVAQNTEDLLFLLNQIKPQIDQTKSLLTSLVRQTRV